MTEQRSPFNLTRILWGIIALFFALQLTLVFRLNLNWDEYFYLSHIHTYLDGRPLEPLQTFHVHLLGWIAALPLSDPDQIVVGRIFMLLCEIGALLCVYRIARQFTSHQAALVAVASWCGAGFALTQGMSFRTDPLAGFLIMSSLALLFSDRLGLIRSMLAGLLAALALMITIKAAIFLPCFVGALVWQIRDSSRRKRTVVHFTVATIVLCAAFAVLFVAHTAQLKPFPGPFTMAEESSESTKTISQSQSILRDVILSQDLLPRWDYISRWLILSLFALIPIFVGVRSRITRIKDDPLQSTALLLLALPIAVLLIYRNAFPYFFPFMMLPVAVLAAIGWENIERPLWRNVALGGAAVTMIAQFVPATQQGQSAQRAIAEVAEKMFPDGTRYIDRNGMLPSFQKSGYFMSSWGVQGTVASGNPALAKVIKREQPPLLIANTPIFLAALDPSFEWSDMRLMAEEEQALRNNYIPHWGAIWVAGKQLGGPSGSFSILVEGQYTIECEGVRVINSVEKPCGETVNLTATPNTWSGGPATLRYGDYIHRPSTPPPSEPIYHGF